MPEITSSKITSSNTALSSVPTLPIPPYGMDTFTDFERDKVFTTLHFKHGGGDRAAVFAWIGAVLDGLTLAGIPAAGPCENTLTPDVARSTKARVKYRCHLKVPVELKVPEPPAISG